MVLKTIQFITETIFSIVACVLIVAALSKLYYLFAGQVAPSAWSIVFKPLLIVLELFFGYFFLTERSCLFRSASGAVLFFGFSLACCYRSFFGVSQCDCFGFLKVPNSVSCAISFCGLAMLGCISSSYLYRSGIFSGSIFAIVLRKMKSIQLGKRVCSCFCFAAILSSCTLYRSVIFNERQNLVTCESVDVGSVAMNGSVEVSVPIKNESAETVEILGTQASCGCVEILSLPAAIRAGQSQNIKCRISGIREGQFKQYVTLFLSCPSQFDTAFELSGFVSLVPQEEFSE